MAEPVATATATQALNSRFLLDYPAEAAGRMESMPPREVAALLSTQPAHAAVRVWSALADDLAEAVLEHLPATTGRTVLSEAEPAQSVAVLARLQPAARTRWLDTLDKEIARELQALLAYPPDTAGRLMDPRALGLPSNLSAAEALQRLRVQAGHGARGAREVYLLDEERRLDGRVEIDDLVFAGETAALRALARPLTAVVQALAPREEVVETLARSAVTALPVISHDGRLLGVIRQSALVAALQEETSLDIQTMVGASREERALSSPGFSLRKRLPWMQINLFTAFLAAAVVGLFESTIAQFTALAVLLPVVAGQSGNAGAQALAVTMRGLVLREISPRHWLRVVSKEAAVGLMNGLAVAATAAVGVYIWSRSPGLVAIISAAMVISMIVAGVAGALVPVVLQRLGQDPAQSSSIILTTVTDVVGFLSFLGIATLFAGLLG
jgi:magnesium transporter